MLRLMKVLPVVTLLVAWLFATPILAQSIWLNQGENQENSLAVEIFKPNFDTPDVTFISTAWFFSGRFSARDNLVLMGELPMAHGEIERDFGNFGSETIVGNPYIGIEFKKVGTRFFGEIGVRLPVVPDDKLVAPLVGVFADIDRLEAFTPDLFAIAGRVKYQSISDCNTLIRLRLGPTFLKNSGIMSGFEDDTELLIDYSTQLGYSNQNIIIVGGLTGRFIATDDESFGDRTLHQLGGNLSLNLESVRPGIHFRIPLDENLINTLDSIVGLNLVINLQ